MDRIYPLKGYFSIFKRDMKGIYQHCGEQRLNRYSSELDFRNNGLEISVIERTYKALLDAAGKRLTYGASSPDVDGGVRIEI